MESLHQINQDYTLNFVKNLNWLSTGYHIDGQLSNVELSKSSLQGNTYTVKLKYKDISNIRLYVMNVYNYYGKNYIGKIMQFRGVESFNCLGLGYDDGTSYQFRGILIN